MSWWFPRLNAEGRICSGNGEVWIDGRVLCAGHSPQWWDETAVLVGGTETRLVDARTGILVWTFNGAYNPRVGNISGISCGDGHWCGWSPTGGLWYDGQLVDVSAAPGAVTETGVLAYLTPYQGPLRDVIVNGTIVRHNVLADEVVASAQIVTWSEWERGVRRAWGLRLGSPPMPLSPLPWSEFTFTVVPVETPSGVWLVAQTHRGLIVYPWGETDGYIIEQECYYHHARWLDDHIEIVGTAANGTLLRLTEHLTRLRAPLQNYHPTTGIPPPDGLPSGTVTITGWAPASGPAPLDVYATVGWTGDVATVQWLRAPDRGDWEPDGEPCDPRVDREHLFTFREPGRYAIGVEGRSASGTPLDRTGRSRLVTVQEKPTMPPHAERYWFCPNIGSQDLLQLFTESNLWTPDRAGVFQFYAQHLCTDITGGPVGPNTYEHLVTANAFTKLRDWGIPIAMEVGSVKSGSTWDCDGSHGRHLMAEAQARVASAGGVLTYIAMDEPLTSAPKCPQTIEQTADYVAEFIRVGQSLGLTVGWIEAWPEVTFMRQLEFLGLLDERGARPRFWHLDVDAGRRPLTAEIATAFRQAANDRGIKLGIIINGDTRTPDYYASVMSWARYVETLRIEWDHVIVQAFPRGPDPRDTIVPPNLPEAESFSHTAILGEVQGLL